MHIIDIVRLLFFPALIAFAAASDLLTMTISNRISVALVAGFAALAVATGMPLTDIGWHAAAAAIVLTGAFVFFAFGWIGGGDAKLAAAISLWFGFDQMVSYLLIASIFGGGLTLLILRFRGFMLPVSWAGQDWIQRLHRKETGVPYGIALAAAALITYPDTIWMKGIGL